MSGCRLTSTISSLAPGPGPGVMCLRFLEHSGGARGHRFQKRRPETCGTSPESGLGTCTREEAEVS